MLNEDGRKKIFKHLIGTNYLPLPNTQKDTGILAQTPSSILRVLEMSMCIHTSTHSSGKTNPESYNSWSMVEIGNAASLTTARTIVNAFTYW